MFFAGIESGRFFSEIWKQSHWVFDQPIDHPRFGVDEFHSYAETQSVVAGRVDLLGRETRNASSDESRLPHTELADFLNGGGTIRLNRVQEFAPQISRWADELVAFFGCPVSVNAYRSKVGALGLGGHYDSHHVVAVQTYGMKTWDLGPLVVKAPSPTFRPRPIVEPGLETSIDLRHGQALYLPPGMWHSTRTAEESVHLAVGIHPPRVSQTLYRLLEAAAERHPLLRESLPIARYRDGLRYRDLTLDEIDGLLDILKHDCRTNPPVDVGDG